MNIVILDKDTREYKGNISSFESFIWTERYWDYGDFELVVPLNAKNVLLISLDDYFKIQTSNTLMIVENIEYVSPLKDEGGKFNITGRSLDSIIDRRILFKDFKKSIKPEAYILQIMNLSFKDEKGDPDRLIDYLSIENNTDEDVETDPVSIDELQGTNISDIILPSLQNAELGFRIDFNQKDNTFSFEIFNGKDKTYIVFSEYNLLLQEAKVYQSVQDFKTFVYVIGNDVDAKINLEDRPSGINRRETYVSASDVNLEDKGYRKELELRGRNELEERKKVITIEGQLMNLGRYRLRRDFDLGDIITIQNPYYRAEARITEVIQSWDSEGYRIYPGFVSKNIEVFNTTYEEIRRPVPVKPEPDPEPETPDIPVDNTPTKLINVEIISAVKMYTNFIVGGTSRTYHQIYIPNYDPSDPENRPIKRFGVRLRGLLPEGWAAGLYSVYCDIFLGSEQKLETIKITFNPGDTSFVGNWYSYLTYDSPYIRLYLYVVANEIGPADIPDDQEPFMNGLVDIRLNNIDDQEYIPSEEGDQLTCQTTYIWENNGNFHRYFSGNSTNVTGIQNVDITVIRQNVLSNESMLDDLDQVIESGGRIWEYDTSSLDNLELSTVESGIVEVPPVDGNYDIPTVGSKFENENIGEFGWRQNVAEFVRSNLNAARFVKGSCTQEMNLLFKKYEIIPDPSIYTDFAIEFHVPSRQNNVSYLELTNDEKLIQTLDLYYYSTIVSNANANAYFGVIKIYGDNKVLKELDLEQNRIGNVNQKIPIIKVEKLYLYSTIKIEYTANIEYRYPYEAFLPLYALFNKSEESYVNAYLKSWQYSLDRFNIKFRSITNIQRNMFFNFNYTLAFKNSTLFPKASMTISKINLNGVASGDIKYRPSTTNTFTNLEDENLQISFGNSIRNLYLFITVNKFPSQLGDSDFYNVDLLIDNVFKQEV